VGGGGGFWFWGGLFCFVGCCWGVGVFLGLVVVLVVVGGGGVCFVFVCGVLGVGCFCVCLAIITLHAISALPLFPHLPPTVLCHCAKLNISLRAF